MKTKRGVIAFLILAVFLSSLDLAGANHECVLKENCGGDQAGHVRKCSLVGDVSECIPLFEAIPHGSSEPGTGFSALDFFEDKLEWIRTGADLDTSSDFLESCKKACSDQPEECDEKCRYRDHMADSLPGLILCEYALKNVKERTIGDILINRVVPEYYTPNSFMYDLNDDLWKERGEDNAVPEGHAYQIILKNYGQYLSEIPQDISRPPEFPEEEYPYSPYTLVTGQRKEACDKELNKLSEEELASAENEPTETVVPSPTDQETSEAGNYEKGGTLKEWKERLQSETGPDSDESKTAAACEALMKQKTTECSQHGGWRTDYMMEIADFRTDEHYEFQDIMSSGCPNTSVREADTTTLDSQAKGGKSEYQVVCSVLCSSWSCDVSSPAVGTEVGEIKSLKGKVEVRQSDDSWKEVDSGTGLYLNDNIRTGKDGQAVIKLADDTVFTLGHDSGLIINEFVYDPNTNIGTLTASLSKGLFRFVTGKMIRGDPSAHIKFRLPDFVIGIRGTDLILSYNPDTKTSVLHLYEGKVDITPASIGNKEEFNAGQTVFVEGDRIIKTLPLSQENWILLVDENELAEESSSSFFVNSFILIILIVGAVLIIRKIKKRGDSKTVKKPSVEHKKPGETSEETKKWGLASLILAILSILFLLLPFVGIVLAILAVISARIQKKHSRTWLAKAGLIIGIIGIVFNAIILIIIIPILMTQ